MAATEGRTVHLMEMPSSSDDEGAAALPVAQQLWHSEGEAAGAEQHDAAQQPMGGKSGTAGEETRGLVLSTGAPPAGTVGHVLEDEPYPSDEEAPQCDVAAQGAPEASGPAHFASACNAAEALLEEMPSSSEEQEEGEGAARPYAALVEEFELDAMPESDDEALSQPRHDDVAQGGGLDDGGMPSDEEDEEDRGEAPRVVLEAMYDSDEGEAHADAHAAPHQEPVHIQEMWSSDEEAFVPPAPAASGAVEALVQGIPPAVDSDDAPDANTERWMANDPQCGLCDDGGELLLCEGRCMRSFHAKCLRMEHAEYDALIASPNPWHCPACVTGMHACFRCGQVGSLSAALEAQRVHKCGVFECTRFYHLACAGPGAAPGFECPLHRCRACQRPGSQAQGDVIPCRRCPVGYHVECIPLAMVQSVEPLRRVWLSNKHLPAGAPPSRVDGSLVYCLRHDGAAWPAGSGAPPEVHFQEAVLHACAQALVLQTATPHRCLGCRAKLRPAAAVRESGGARGKAWGDAVEAAFKAVVAARTAAPSLADLRDSLGGPANYKRRRCQHTIGEQQLQLLETTVADAQRLKTSGRPAEALAKLDGTVRRILDTSFAQLRVAFAPFNHSCRYTSYGRHFTRPSVLQDVSNRLALFLRHGDTVVDSSCGANDWLPSVRKAAADVGIFSLKFRAFDIFTPANKDPGPVVVQDWFETSHADLGYASGDSLVIGLNPPFGVQNALAEQFITKAVEFRARLIVLIVPPSTRMPAGYAELVRDTKLCAGHAFYLPGSHDPKQGGHADDWCKVAPAFIVLQRADTLGLGGPRELIDPGGLAWVER